SAKEIEDLAERAIEQSRNTLNQIAQAKRDFPTWENSVQPILDEYADFFEHYSNCYFVSNVSTDKSVRDASVEANKKLDAYLIEKAYRKDIYDVVRTYVEKNPNENLDPEQSYVLKKILKDFERV